MVKYSKLQSGESCGVDTVSKNEGATVRCISIKNYGWMMACENSSKTDWIAIINNYINVVKQRLSGI